MLCIHLKRICGLLKIFYFVDYFYKMHAISIGSPLQNMKHISKTKIKTNLLIIFRNIDEHDCTPRQAMKMLLI